MDLTRVSLVVLKSQASTVTQVVDPLSYDDLNTPIYLANWKNRLATQDRWSTTLSICPIDGTIETTGLRKRPLRSQQVTLTAHNKTQLNHLLSDLNKHGKNKNTRVPIYVDRVKVYAPSNIGETRIYIRTTLRRFFPGQNIIVVPKGHGVHSTAFGYVINGYVIRLEDVAAGYVVVSSLPFDVEEGFYVYPLIDAYPLISYTGRVLNCSNYEVQVSFNEISGGNTLPKQTIFTPTEFHEGLPVLQLRPSDQFDQQAVRFSEQLDTARTNHVELYDMDPVLTAQYPYVFHSRAEYFKLLSFWDFIEGRKTAFWTYNLQKIIEVLSYPDNDQILIKKDQDLSSIRSYLKKLIFESQGGVFSVVDVLSIEESSDNYVITFDGDLLMLNPKEIRPAIKARSTRDSLQTSWATFDVCSTSLEIREDV